MRNGSLVDKHPIKMAQGQENATTIFAVFYQSHILR